jgi:hypothetical protein
LHKGSNALLAFLKTFERRVIKPQYVMRLTPLLSAQRTCKWAIGR